MFTRSEMAGLFFCLAPAEGAGLLFCPTAHEPHKSVYSGFYIIHAVIPPTPQNGAQGFTGAFPAICRVFSLLCGCASGYTAPPAPRWSVSQYRSTSTDTRYHRNAKKLHRSAQPQTMPARRGQLPPSADRWQVLRPAHPPMCQRLHLYEVSPAAVSLLPTPGGLQSGTWSTVNQGGHSGTLHPAEQSSRRGATGGAETLTAYAASLFGLSPDS